jgi:hypothetical protein
MPKPRGKQKWLAYLSKISCDKLGFSEWRDITGLGVREFGQYNITLSGVYFRRYSDVEIGSAPSKSQSAMDRANQHLPLTFPFTLQALLEFLDGPAGRIGGHTFSLPRGFREAATEILAPPPTSQEKIVGATESADEKTFIDPDAKDWIAKAKIKAQEIGDEQWAAGIRQISARNICGTVATSLAEDQSTWGKQGPRSSDNVRVGGLRGWKYKPTTAAIRVD